ncbi:hypothetical protein E2C01_038912 [Portunus trituberculatus]|uniref:Uncharacterized protein n=1 Tax=Portunus trituberculatus TaxID=210409 RepID=A0A5B7FC74_PORTR|nr:hypothetical protein [Portunus trituberculatus]
MLLKGLINIILHITPYLSSSHHTIYYITPSTPLNIIQSAPHPLTYTIPHHILQPGVSATPRQHLNGCTQKRLLVNSKRELV